MALTGSEILQVQPIAANGQLSGQTLQTTTQQIANLAALESTQESLSTNAGTAGATITAAILVTKNLQRTGPTLPFSDTTDTAANIIAALGSGAVVGAAFKFYYENSSGDMATIVGGSNVTMSGITVVPPKTGADFLVSYATATTVTMVGLNLKPLLGMQSAQATTTTNYVSSTTLTVPQGLVLDLPVGGYVINGLIQGSGPAVAGINVQLTGTAGLTLSLANLTGWNYNGTTINAVTNVTALSSDLANSANAYTGVSFEGTLTVSVGGQLSVSTAQHTSSTATCSVVTGSYIQAQRFV